MNKYLYIKQENIVKDFILLSSVVLLCVATFNTKQNYHVLPTATDDGVITNRDSIPTLVIPDIR